MIRGTFTGMEPGTTLGHEAVGVVEELRPMVRAGAVDPVAILTEPLSDAIEACRAFDRRDPGWIKVELAGRR